MALTTLSLKWPRGQLQVACEDLEKSQEVRTATVAELPPEQDSHNGGEKSHARLHFSTTVQATLQEGGNHTAFVTAY